MAVAFFIIAFALVAAGAASIAFGVPINEFGFGNTLIMSGSVALVGGFILAALAGLLREMVRFADAAERQLPIQIPRHQGKAPPPVRPTPKPAGTDPPDETSQERPPSEPKPPLPAPPFAPRPPAPAVRTGTVDGVGYTLYADGSIEADFSHGRKRFSTVEELQDYMQRLPPRV